MSQYYSRLKSLVDCYEKTCGKKPEYLVLDSFFHERLKIEMKESIDDRLGDLKSIFGIEVKLLRNGLIVS